MSINENHIKLCAGELYQYSKFFLKIGKTLKFKFIFLEELPANERGEFARDLRFKIYNIERNKIEFLNETITMRDRVTAINDG